MEYRGHEWKKEEKAKERKENRFFERLQKAKPKAR
jgi:hypothetical protein